MAMFPGIDCTRCGNRAPLGAKFCGRCGAPLAAAQPEGSAGLLGRPFLLAGIIIGVALVVSLFVAVVYKNGGTFSSSSSSSKQAAAATATPTPAATATANATASPRATAAATGIARTTPSSGSAPAATATPRPAAATSTPSSSSSSSPGSNGLIAVPPPHTSPLVGLTITPGGNSSVHHLGETLNLCYTSKAGLWIRLYDTGTPSQLLAQGFDDGTGDCYAVMVTLPTGLDTVRIDVLNVPPGAAAPPANASVVDYATIAIVVVR